MININSKKTSMIIIPTFQKGTSQTQRGSEGLGIVSKKNSLKTVAFFNPKKNERLKTQIKDELKSLHFESKQEETIFLKIEKQKILLIGINEKYTLEDLRRAYSIVFKVLKQKKEFQSTIEILSEKENDIKSIIEGLDLSDYVFDKYLSEKNKEKFNISLDIPNKFSNLVKKTLLVTSNVKTARSMINENADEMVPKKFESLAKQFAKKNKLKIKVLNEKDIQKQKLGLLWAVGQGSINPPRLIIVEYNGDKKSKEKIALVGKGITFDTGGLNLKPTNYIEDMRTDMGGAATMFASFKSAVELKLKKNIVLVLCCAENAISAKAFKPGDIFTSYKGITVEITNTDAEGRLVLADGISYVQKNYKPTQVIDAATLTGAIMVALGKKLIGMFGNDDKIKKSLFESGEKTYDRVWEMPIYEEHSKVLKSKFADCVNCDLARYGGASSAAAFIEKFVEDKTKWIHLDIAGAARGYDSPYYNPEFGTGKGVRLLVDYLEK